MASDASPTLQQLRRWEGRAARRAGDAMSVNDARLKRDPQTPISTGSKEAKGLLKVAL